MCVSCSGFGKYLNISVSVPLKVFIICLQMETHAEQSVQTPQNVHCDNAWSDWGWARWMDDAFVVAMGLREF